MIWGKVAPAPVRSTLCAPADAPTRSAAAARRNRFIGGGTLLLRVRGSKGDREMCEERFGVDRASVVPFEVLEVEVHRRLPAHVVTKSGDQETLIRILVGVGPELVRAQHDHQ